MDAVGGVGGADIDMHHDALTAPGHQREARRHVCRGVFVRTAHHLRHGFAEFAPMRHLLDDWRVIGAEITEQIIDADFFEALEQIIGGGKIADVGLPGNRRIHDATDRFCLFLSGLRLCHYNIVELCTGNRQPRSQSSI